MTGGRRELYAFDARILSDRGRTSWSDLADEVGLSQAPTVGLSRKAGFAWCPRAAGGCVAKVDLNGQRGGPKCVG